MGRGGGRRSSKTAKKKTISRAKMGLQLSQEGKVKLSKRNAVFFLHNSIFELWARFRAWAADEFLIKVFQQRGWKYIGEPCLNGREDYPQSMYDARENEDFDKGHCLYWGDDCNSYPPIFLVEISSKIALRWGNIVFYKSSHSHSKYFSPVDQSKLRC